MVVAVVPSIMGGIWDFNQKLLSQPWITSLQLLHLRCACSLSTRTTACSPSWRPSQTSPNLQKWCLNPPRNDGKLLSKSVTKSQSLALSPSLSEPLAQVQKKTFANITIVRTSDPKKSHKLLEWWKCMSGTVLVDCNDIRSIDMIFENIASDLHSQN